MNIKPIGNRVLIKQKEVEEKTASGIILSSSTQVERPNIGKILEIGNGDELQGLSVNQNVVYAKYKGTNIKNNDEEYIILDVEDVIAIVE